MKNGLKKFWGTIKAELEMRPQPEQSQSGQVKQETSKTGILPPIMPEMHLTDMIQYRFSGEYLFHGLLTVRCLELEEVYILDIEPVLLRDNPSKTC